MTHDEQWQVIIDQLDERLCEASDDMGITIARYRSHMAKRLEARDARRLGENPILWKLANG